MPESTPEASPDRLPPGGTVVVEAPTTEVALREIATRIGEGAEIVAAEKVRKGGVAGFFTREQVQLTVKVPAEGATGGQTVQGQAASGAGSGAGPDAGPGSGGVNEAGSEPRADAATRSGLADVLARMAGETDSHEADFSAALRRQLVPTPTAAAAQPPAETGPGIAPGIATGIAPGSATGIATGIAPESPGIAPGIAAATPNGHAQARSNGHAEPRRVNGQASNGQAARVGWVRDPSSLPGTGPMRWSPGALLRLGLPSALVEATEAQEPVDDAGWTQALAAAVAGYCRPLPTGDSLVIGPKAAKIGEALGLDVYAKPQTPPADGSAALRTKDSLAARSWLADARGSRWLHLVVGGSGWHGLLFDEPLVVSWAGADSLPTALNLCATFGMVLGYGISTGCPLVRGNPVDVAVAIRDLLPRI